jgi:heptosyltransferase-2
MSGPRVLVVAPAWIGDAIISQPLLTLLKSRSPAPAIDVLAPGWVRAVYDRMAEVADLVESPFAHGQLAWRRRRRVAAGLATRGYAQALVLPNSLKSALVPWLARIPLRTGFKGEQRYGLLNDRRVLDPARLPRLVDRFAALAFPPGSTLPSPLPTPSLRVDFTAQQASLARLGLDTTRPIVALCPGAEYGPAKRWPVAHYAAVARKMLAEGHAVWIFGSAHDAAIGAEIAALAENVVDLCGRTSLAEAIDLLALADVAITNDSGLMHIAAAVGARVVAVFGSSTPAYTPPLSPRARTLSLELSCSPCFARECPLGHMNCLNELKPERVQDTIAALATIPSIPR